jgi:enolase
VVVLAAIRNVCSREVFDTRNLPSLEVDVLLEDGSMGRAIAPAGTSRGSNESFDLRDGDTSYFGGMGVQRAARNVNTEIAEALKGKDAADQEQIDRLMIKLDGTANKSRLGGNAIVATSIANAKAAAKSLRIPLFEHLGGGTMIPIPWFLAMIGGPVYAGVDYRTSDFQEFAYYALRVETYRDGYVQTLSVYKALCDVLRREKEYVLPRLSGGRLAPRFSSNMEALSLMTRAIEEAGYTPGKDYAIYLDVASTHFYKDGEYHLKADNRTLTRDEMIDFLAEIRDAFPVVSMEDCLHEEDWEGWKALTERLGNRTQLVGDDFFTTNPSRLRRGVAMGAANAVVIKPNQIGTITETVDTIKAAKQAGYGTVLSSRSGEIGDMYLSHLLVGQGLGQGKIAAFDIERIKLNELLRIEEHLGEKAIQAGAKPIAKYLE